MMLMRSARTRAAVWTGIVCAAVLGAFAAAAWWKLRETRLQALDRDLEAAGTGLALSARWSLAPAAVERRLEQRFGDERSEGRAFAISAPGAPPQLSDHWPTSLNPDSLPHSGRTVERELMDGPGGPGGRDGPPGRDGPGGRGPRRPRGEGPGPPPPRGDGEGRVGGSEFPRGGPGDEPSGRPGDGPGFPPGRPALYEPVFSTVAAGGRTWRVGVFGHAGSGIVIRLALDVDVFAADLRSTARAFWLALPGALVVIVGGAWLAARRSLAPVEDLTGRVQALSLARPNDRLDSGGADEEFAPIIEAWNEMLDRLERSYGQAVRFSADASHELKTPLAVMRTTVERGLAECQDGSAEQRTYASLLDEVDHLQSIIEGLLLLSRADAGRLATSRERLNFSTWIQPLIEDASLMGEDRGISVTSRIDADLEVWADPVLLARAVHNLLRNAVMHNEPSGTVECALRQVHGHIELRVTNTGVPIPAAEVEAVFERFRRGSNTGGSGDGRGLGIGLSLSREIAVAHGGSLRLVPGDGPTTFVLVLPSFSARSLPDFLAQ